ncbi:MAG: DUF2379 family protein [Candidatus Thalassarchaeum sp.]|nr:DUF2379 family protein [Candidatus Thalassarchaeum sp.]
MTVSCSCQVCLQNQRKLILAGAATRKAIKERDAARALVASLGRRLNEKTKRVREVTGKLMQQQQETGKMRKARDFWHATCQKLSKSLDDEASLIKPDGVS